MSASLTELVTIGLPILETLAKKYAGSLYIKLAGTVGQITSYTASHPEVVAAAGDVVNAVEAALPGASKIITPAIAAVSVAGSLGQMIAADPTVQGPQK